MRKIKNVRTSVIVFFEILVCFLVTAACVIMGGNAEKSYDFSVGSVSTAKISAPRQIENTYATERKRLEAQASITPLFKLDQNITVKVHEKIISFFEYLDERRDSDEQAEQAAEHTEELLEDILEPAANSDAELNAENGEEAAAESVASPIVISDAQFNGYKTLTRSQRIEFRDILADIADSIMSNGIKEEADARSLLYVRDELNKTHFPAEIINLGYTVITSSLEPNLVIDEEATQSAIETKVSQVEPVTVLEGQKIIDEGEIVTEEIYNLLSALDLISNNNEKNVIEILGASALIALLLTVFITYLLRFHKKTIVSRKKTALLCLLYLFAIVMLKIMSYNITVYVIPLTVPLMLVAVLINQRIAILLNFLLIFLGALVYKGNEEFLLYFMITGSIAVLVSKITFERAKIVIAGSIICAVNIATVAAINAFFYKSLEPNLMLNAAIAASNGLLSLLIAMGSLPIWEAVFDIITPVKLLDLTNPNNALLRRLTIEAPGTYHHSLIVANLAEQAAYDIGANAPLARVGGYYHDIGKLKYPYFFGENQAGMNPHDHMNPAESARIIMKHVPLGIEYADTYKLPRPIKDIILQHHGTTLVKYFYHKAVENSSEDKVRKEDFRYKGEIPTSKESAIVMLADTAEAAVRSMATSSKSIDEADEFLKRLIKDKLEDSQLDESMLTLNELGVIREAFMKIFKGMYHERVKYPDENGKNGKTDANGTVAKEGVS